MMKQVQEMQRKMAQAQEELAVETVEASAGGGMITVVVSGALEVKEVRIKPEAVDPDDVEMLQDLVVAATNEALRAAQDVVEAAELPRALDGHDVEGLLDHAEHARVAARALRGRATLRHRDHRAHAGVPRPLPRPGRGFEPAGRRGTRRPAHRGVAVARRRRR